MGYGPIICEDSLECRKMKIAAYTGLADKSIIPDTEKFVINEILGRTSSLIKYGNLCVTSVVLNFGIRVWFNLHIC